MQDLVSPNIRGAVLALCPFVAPAQAYLSWSRNQFYHPDYNDLHALYWNPAVFNSVDIFTTMSKNVDWSDPDQAVRGLRALSLTIRAADYDDSYDTERKFVRAISDIRTACIEDGFVFSENPYTISHGDAIALDELNLAALSTAEGIQRKIKKINISLLKEKDNAEVVALSKDLMEAVAAAVLLERRYTEENVRKMTVGERCGKALTELGVRDDNGAGKIVEGLNFISKALNKISMGVAEMRRDDTDEGHGMPQVRVVSDGQARLALQASLLWSNYVLDELHDQSVPPF
ncbi:abortive infection family protein [Corynebacterium diphtheriae]|uniref:abortive infection family protein n=1 Tax=Corynebacterium diphtheriae TaxID=1717 RepID=UPI000A1F9064|nr:abortive infection family protein [Corynebacterium diphtheriae]OSQ11143.1 hypothetical protein B1A57_10465 [Corynebacterium diphtheriae]PSA75129.1 hypothetical protein BT092_09615 [Corynebacterium diphtheriae]CAB0521807.1 hypothetical protein FRC061569_01852 [Corynebacterium diphtheriae]CAB0525262.1 hypothetical protein FRC020322_02093 [Corynebacterium diphtheriae]CAB0525442.1 hypothetical protein FRC020338_02086 [Corynebacterium diphtheriae]